MSIALPYRKIFDPWGKGATFGIYLEGVVGYAQLKQRATDIYAGQLPGLQTSISSKSTTYGGLVGIGPAIRITDQLTVTPIGNAGVARIENDTSYGGPGTAVSARILDGVAFNWDGLTVSGGGALRVDWVRPLGAGYRLEVLGRYDARWTQTVETDDSAQEFSTRVQFLTLRAEVIGPTGFQPFGQPLSWRALLAYRHFIEGSLEGVVRDMVLIGGGLELAVAGRVPLVESVSFNAGVIVGPHVVGYTVGMGLSF